MPDITAPTQKLVRRFIAAVVLAQFLLFTGAALALQPKNPGTPKAQKNGGRHQIDLLEEKWRNAILKNDVAALDSLLAEDYIGIMANGTLQTRDQTLASIRTGGWHVTALDISDRKVRFYGRTALVTCLVQVEGSNPEGVLTGTYRYTHVYARDARGVWKIVNFEASRLGHPHHSDGLS